VEDAVVFLTFRTKRGLQAINVSEIASLEYRTKAVPGEEGGSSGLELRLRTPAGGADDGDGHSVRLRGEQARQAWQLLAERGLLWSLEAASPAVNDEI
jgi:hypothetical protein